MTWPALLRGPSGSRRALQVKTQSKFRNSPRRREMLPVGLRGCLCIGSARNGAGWQAHCRASARRRFKCWPLLEQEDTALPASGTHILSATAVTAAERLQRNICPSRLRKRPERSAGCCPHPEEGRSSTQISAGHRRNGISGYPLFTGADLSAHSLVLASGHPAPRVFQVNRSTAYSSTFPPAT